MISSDALNHAIAQAKRQRQITETVSELELHDPKTVELLRTTCESILRVHPAPAPNTFNRPSTAVWAPRRERRLSRDAQAGGLRFFLILSKSNSIIVVAALAAHHAGATRAGPSSCARPHSGPPPTAVVRWRGRARPSSPPPQRPWVWRGRLRRDAIVPDPSADAFVSFVTKHNKSGSDPVVSGC